MNERTEFYRTELQAMLPEGYAITRGPYLGDMRLYGAVSYNGEEYAFDARAPINLATLVEKIKAQVGGK